MKSVLCGVVALLFASSAFAQPTRLTEKQMDRVTAGTLFINTDFAGLANTIVSLKSVNLISISALVAEDTAFQGLTLVTIEPR